MLAVDCLSVGPFLKLLHFRALSGWTDEIAFDSLTFHWATMNAVLFFLDGAALAGLLSSYFLRDLYRSWGWAVALVFLVNSVYPWCLALHYVRSFHFILFLGMVMNGSAFGVLAFLKRRLGLVTGPVYQGKAMSEFKEITVDEARKMLESGKAIFVDVRDPGSYQSAHVPGAVPLNDSNIQDFVAKTDRSKPIVCYCYHGHTSQGAAAYLKDQGFQDVYSVMGGFEMWRQTEKIES